MTGAIMQRPEILPWHARVPMQNFLRSQKAYIGPIGDDFPSLIPLIFGLLMFFTAFTITFNSFDNANTRFNDDVALLKVSRTLQSNSYIFSHEDFKGLCNQVGVVDLKFVATLTEEWVNPAQQPVTVARNIFDARVFRNAKNEAFYCSNVAPSGGVASVSSFVQLNEVADSRVVSRTFPIAVEDNKVVKPMHLVVVAWR